MSDAIRLIIEIITYLWPFRIVMEWERANYYVFGRMWKTMGPGLKLVVPFFTEIRQEGIVPTIFMSPLQSITLKDGSTLTFSATITLEIADLAKAYNAVLHWEQTTIELASGLLAEKLAETDLQQFEVVNRGRLIGGCKVSLNNSLSDYGVRVTGLRFNNFVRNMRVYRLFNDSLQPNTQ